MKKLVFIGSAVASLLAPIQAFAEDKSVKIELPVNRGFASLSDFIKNALSLVFVIGAFLVLIMLIIGAYEWIASGGDKENVAKARNRIINAMIGLLVLAVAFALVRLLAQFTGFDIGNLVIPTPASFDPNRL